MKLVTIATIAILVIAASSRAQIVNGDFDTPPGSSGWLLNGIASVGTGGSPGNALHFVGTGGGTATQGRVPGMPDPQPPRWLCGPGATGICTLTFSYRADPGSTFNLRFGNPGAGGGSTTFSNTSTGAVLNGTWNSRSLTAACGEVYLTITGNGTSGPPPGRVSFDNFVDECTPVPEPATCAVLGIGALVLARRKSQPKNR